MNQISLEFSVPAIVDILSISTAFMLGLLFITSKSKNKKANLFLGLFLWSLSLEVLGAFVEILEVDLLIINTSLFTIPLLFFYINETLNRKFNWIHLLFFIPGILTNFDLSFYVFEYVFNISLLIYILKIVKNHQLKVGDFYSDIENKTLSWIYAIVYIFLFFQVLWIIEDLVGLQNESFTEYFAFTSNILTFFMIYWIGYNGFSQSEIFTSSLFQSETKEDVFINFSETKKQFEKISSTILKEKLFTKTDLNLKSLSLQLNLKEKELSKLINTHTQNNFYHFINQFRIEEFKNLLTSPKAKQLSLLGLAEEAGFSSKSTFYTAFKNSEGVTPKQYQNQLKKSE